MTAIPSPANVFRSRDEVKALFLRVLGEEAEAKGQPLSDFEREFLLLSASDLFEARERLSERFGVSPLSCVERLVVLLQSAKQRQVIHLHSSGASVPQLIEAGKKTLVSKEDSMWIVLRDASSSLSPKAERRTGAVIAGILMIAAIIYAVLRTNYKFGFGAAVVVVVICIVAFAIDRMRQSGKA